MPKTYRIIQVRDDSLPEGSDPCEHCMFNNDGHELAPHGLGEPVSCSNAPCAGVHYTVEKVTD